MEPGLLALQPPSQPLAPQSRPLLPSLFLTLEPDSVTTAKLLLWSGQAQAPGQWG